MRQITLLTLIVISGAQLCFGQQNSISELKLNSSITENLHSDTSQLFKVVLQKNTFLFAIVQQLGVDIKVEILDSEKNLLNEINHQNQPYGPEQVAFTSSKNGAYYIRVSTVSKPASGKYSIHIQKIQEAATTNSQRVDELFAFYDRPDHPGVSVAVVENGRIVHTGCYGDANLTSNTAIENNTTFHIGSETKQFVAFAIASLIYEGKLSKDDDIRVYLKEVPFFGDTIRIKHLLNHTSGIREFYDDLTAIAGWEKGIKPITAIQYQKELNFKPGEKYSYCNTEYGLLQEIFERVSGEKLSAWLQNKVFAPLQMDQTFFCDDSKTLIKNYAKGYLIDHKGDFVQNTYLPDGIISTATDLSKWILNYEHPIAGNDSIFNIMGKTDTLNNGESITYTCGQEKIRKEGLTFWGHGGGFEGYKSYILRCPEMNFGVVVLSNFDYFNNWFMARKVAEAYLGINLTETPPSEPAHKPIHQAPDKMPGYCGTYWFNHDLSIQIKIKDTVLIAQISGRPEFIIIPHDNGKYYYQNTEVSIDFMNIQGDTIGELEIFQDNETYNASKQRPEAITAEALLKYTGKYYCDEIETIYTIEKSNENY
nr:beta-lactamase family protein [Bacteroidota bacterium]